MANENIKAIKTVTVGAGGATYIDFDNIPQIYTDLMIKISARSSRNDYSTNFTNIRFNSSTSGYSYKNLVAQAANSPISQSSNTLTYAYLGYTNQTNNNSGIFSNLEIYIPNYKSSNNKSFSSDSVMEANDTTNNNMGFFTSLWSNSAAITSIRLAAGEGGANFSDYNFLEHTTATLYGITVYTDEVSPKASGGRVTSDASYWYHTFTNSGTLTPSQSVTADVLVIAGGGGAGYNWGGGGGAGGLLYNASQSLVNGTNYVTTIGGGGAGSNPNYGRGTNGTNSSFIGGAISLTATGGGAGGGGNSGGSGNNGASGGSGGGGCGQNSSFGAGSGGGGTPGQGNNGAGNQSGYGGGGGGAGAAATSTSGGNGSSSYSSWGLATSTGQNISGTYWYAGGGCGSSGVGGNGGGGSYGTPGMVSTGGGAGGDFNGTGGSGIIIIRYAK
jgi:hypothetical protein